MSVSHMSGLKMGTPSKRYVDCEISGWMETINKEHTNQEHLFMCRKLPQAPSKSADLGPFRIKDQQKKEPNYLKQLNRAQGKENVHRQFVSRTIQVRKVLKQKHLNCLRDYEGKSQVDRNSWHCKPLTKHAFKLKENNFKSHLVNKSLDIIGQHNLNRNQKLTVTQVLRNRNASLYVDFL